ncbi:MAG: hypothetical protein KGS00_12990 [Alphaproteobacteria bacterium]|nr:hypothetical protein [Alphaproteobacteria bacterium]
MPLSLDSSGVGSLIASLFKRVGIALGRVGFGIFLALAALAALLATTVVGLMLAVAAVCIGFAARLGGRGGRGDSARALEARRTADGWVVEPHSARR